MRLAALSSALLCASVVAACSSDHITPPPGTPPATGDFVLSRAGGSPLPFLDSADSVDLHDRVEYREIYLERGSLTISSDSARFETRLHYAQYAVTFDVTEQRHLELRAVLDFDDRGVVHRGTDGALDLVSDATPGVVHHAVPQPDGYTLQYEFSATTPPLPLSFRPSLSQ